MIRCAYCRGEHATEEEFAACAKKRIAMDEAEYRLDCADDAYIAWITTLERQLDGSH